MIMFLFEQQEGVKYEGWDFCLIIFGRCRFIIIVYQRDELGEREEYYLCSEKGKFLYFLGCGGQREMYVFKKG